MTSLRIVGVSGSTRKDSFNTKLINLALRTAEEAGAQVTLVHLKELSLPLYDGDLEQESGLPEAAANLKRLLDGADAVIISSPEYNASMSAVLKNAIDWTSRPGAVEGSVYAGKPALLISASPGGLGGMRGLNHLRDVLTNLGMHINPKTQSIPSSHQAFDQTGELKDERTRQNLEALVRSFLEVAERLSRKPAMA